MANTEKVRLNKYLSQAGICSRREADVLIEGGKVSVNRSDTGRKRWCWLITSRLE